MQTANIKNFTNGWFIGDFRPNILQTREFEAAHHAYEKGASPPPHVHRIGTEYNYVIRGRLIASGVEMSDGDIFAYLPGESSNVTFLEDTDLFIVKVPSVPGDKFPSYGMWRNKKYAFSQNGEDGIVEFIFDRFDERGIPYNNLCVEFGAADGVGLSNTRALIQRGWKSIQIECNEKFEDLRRNYQDNPLVRCLNLKVESSGTNSYDHVVGQHAGGELVSFLSIDVDTNNLEIFKSIRSRPLLVCVENNSYMEEHKGEGITTFAEAARGMGYSLICCVANLFFLESSLVKTVGYPELTPREAWEGYLHHAPQKDREYVMANFPDKYWER